jgi:hypothetical protein
VLAVVHGVLVSLTWFAAGPGIALALTVYLQEARGITRSWPAW